MEALEFTTTNTTTQTYSFGDVVWVEMCESFNGSHIQGKSRPCVVVGHELSLKNSPVMQVIPLTSKIKCTHIKGHVVLVSGGLPRPSMLLPEQISTLPKEKATSKIGCLNKSEIDKIRHAIKFQLGI